MFSSLGFVKVFAEATHPSTLAEMSAAEISRLDATTLFERYGDELKSDKQFSQEQKDAVQAVLMTNHGGLPKGIEKQRESLSVTVVGWRGFASSLSDFAKARR